MKELDYSAGAVSKGFWFLEFKKYMEEYLKGKSHKDIRQKQLDENFLMAPSIDYGKRMVGEIKKRISALPEEIIGLFPSLNVTDQKIINLLGIMLTDRLFFEFIYEGYREALIIGTKEFEDSQIRVFFNNKSDQSEKVAGYTLEAKRRLGRAYKTYMREANLLKEEDGITVINKVIMDLDLEVIMKKSTLLPYFKGITGGQ